eukprot:Pgem_evm1s9159
MPTSIKSKVVQDEKNNVDQESKIMNFIIDNISSKFICQSFIFENVTDSKEYIKKKGGWHNFLKNSDYAPSVFSLNVKNGNIGINNTTEFEKLQKKKKIINYIEDNISNKNLDADSIYKNVTGSKEYIKHNKGLKYFLHHSTSSFFLADGGKIIPKQQQNQTTATTTTRAASTTNTISTKLKYNQSEQHESETFNFLSDMKEQGGSETSLPKYIEVSSHTIATTSTEIIKKSSPSSVFITPPPIQQQHHHHHHHQYQQTQEQQQQQPKQQSKQQQLHQFCSPENSSALLVGKYLNGKPYYHDPTTPFCFLAIGTQGAGKSHSLNILIENCIGVSSKYAENKKDEDNDKNNNNNINNRNSHDKAKQPQKLGNLIHKTETYSGTSTLILHYSDFDNSICETIGIGLCPQLKLDMIIYVSPSYYLQRAQFYSESGATVYPLLFNWNQINVSQIKKLMGVDTGKTSNQLYVKVMLKNLRNYQRKNKTPPLFSKFREEILNRFENPSQKDPLEQRLEIIEELLTCYEPNKKLIEHCYGKNGEVDAGNNIHGINGSVGPNQVVIVDLTDPLLGSNIAEIIFDVVMESFRNLQIITKDGHRVGKLIAIDEAHKYLTENSSFSESIVTAVRLMRHDALRILISTQSPLKLPAEVLELSSLVFLHHFHSRDWYEYLQKKLSLPSLELGMKYIETLDPGQALLFQNMHHRKKEDIVEDFIRRKEQIATKECKNEL